MEVEASRKLKISNILESLKIGLKILLPVFDTATDVYTLYRYYDPSKSLMLKAFTFSLVTLLAHNLISSIHGIVSISTFHLQSPLSIWKSAFWKSFTIFLYAVGLGSIIAPIDSILSIGHYPISER